VTRAGITARLGAVLRAGREAVAAPLDLDHQQLLLVHRGLRLDPVAAELQPDLARLSPRALDAVYL
jgi:hypothetical protein